MAQYLDATVAPLLSEGCRRLSLPPAASVELLRFLKLKSWYDGLPAARRPCGMSPGAGVDRLWHFMLLNTRVSTAVHAALGVGAVEHVGTDEQDLSDADKMLQRLLSMNMMAAEGWAPNTQLWEDPGTIMHQISTAPGAPLLKYTCPAMTPAQLRTLEAHLQAVYPGGHPFSNGFAAEESTSMYNRSLNSGWGQQQNQQLPAQPQPAQQQLQQPQQSPHSRLTPPALPDMQLTVLLHGPQGAVLSSLTVTTPANATVGDVKRCLKSVQDLEWCECSVLFCAGVGVLADDAASISQLGICDGFVLRWCKQRPRFAARSVAVRVGKGVFTASNVDGRLTPWMWVGEASQVVQLVTAIPVHSQVIVLKTSARSWHEHEMRRPSAQAGQKRLDDLALDWPAQPLTIEVYNKRAIVLHVVLPSQLGGSAVDVEVLFNPTMQQIMQLALRNVPSNILQQHLAGGRPRLFASHIPHDLQPDSTLRDLGLGEGDVLRLLLPGAPHPVMTPSAQVFVKTLTDKTLSINVSLQACVGEFQRLITATEGIPVGQQRIIFNGQQLQP